jgi:hypothetical protein
MNANWKHRLSLAVGAALVVAILILASRLQPVQAQREVAPATGPRYSVVETEGHNLIVTDNQRNTLYFYTIDKDKEIGTELRLRATLDLNKVGQPTIKPEKPKSE